MNENSYSLGIDIGGTNTVFGLVSNNGLVLKKSQLKPNLIKGQSIYLITFLNKLRPGILNPMKLMY